MKFAIKVLALLAFSAATAFAACPPNLPYGCHPMPNGKMACGCGE